MEDDVSYESLPVSTTLTAHMVAGATAGIMEHCVMYPIDSVKTRMQSLVPDPRATYRNMFHALSQIIREESVWHTMRGIDATAYGSGPAHAVYFACYEHLKKVLSRPNQSNHLAHGVAGCGAIVVHDIVYNPFEVIKQRMQVFGSPYKSWLDCVRVTLANEGFGAFYRSFSTQLAMNIPYQSLHFVVYEFCQDALNRERRYHPMSHILSGGAAGAVASAATTPFDVVKTLLNTQEKNAVPRGEGGQRGISGMKNAVRTVYRMRGLGGFFSGLPARVVYQIPSTAIAWGVYECFKHYILKHGTGGGQSI